MLLNTSFVDFILSSVPLANYFWYAAFFLETIIFTALAIRITPKPAKKEAWTKKPIKQILNIRTYMIFITELRFLGNCPRRKQSTWSRFASYPILNFLLHNTEYFKDFLTMPKAIVFPRSHPNSVSLYPACPSKKDLKNRTRDTITSHIIPYPTVFS